MFLRSGLDRLHDQLESFGLADRLKQHGSALIKINLARPPEPNHPRTDSKLLKSLITYILSNRAKCVVTESAEGYLTENLKQIGLGDLLEHVDIDVIDLDESKAIKVEVNGEHHFIPECFYDHHIRIAVPCATKRESMLFSNNVKLFVGAVPRRFYNDHIKDRYRAKIHENLDVSIANIYIAIMKTVPFQLFINGGNAYYEGKGAFQFDDVYIGNDGIELDIYMQERIFRIPRPEYLDLCSQWLAGKEKHEELV